MKPVADSEHRADLEGHRRLCRGDSVRLALVGTHRGWHQVNRSMGPDERKDQVTDLRTRPLEEQRRDQAAPGSRIAPRGTTIVLCLVLGVLVLGLLVGWLASTSAGTRHAEIEQARRQQVVDYFERQYQTMADARTRNEEAHWQDVIDYYGRQYELVGGAPKPVIDLQSARWEAVVAYYEQRWELQEK